MTPLDVVAIVMAILQAVLRMIERGFTKDQVLVAIRAIEPDAAQIDADVDALAHPPAPAAPVKS